MEERSCEGGEGLGWRRGRRGAVRGERGWDGGEGLGRFDFLF